MSENHKTIIAQYNRDNSNLCTLINQFAEALNIDGDLNEFYHVFWNINTSIGYWLDCWGVIVGVDRYLTIPENEGFFGFDEATDQLSLNDGIMYIGENGTQTFILSDEVFRRVVIAKAMANIAACDAFSLNAIFSYFYAEQGRAYVNSPSTMSINYVHEFYLEPWQKALYTQNKVFPRPAGVLVNILELPDELFGFAEGYDYEGFNSGIIFQGGF